MSKFLISKHDEEQFDIDDVAKLTKAGFSIDAVSRTVGSQNDNEVTFLVVENREVFVPYEVDHHTLTKSLDYIVDDAFE